MHEFILDHIETILAIIILAQAIILYGQSKIYDWTRGLLKEVLVFMKASGHLHNSTNSVIKRIKEKINLEDN